MDPLVSTELALPDIASSSLKLAETTELVPENPLLINPFPRQDLIC